MAPTSKLRGKHLPSHWSAVQHDSIKTDYQTPFILTAIKIGIHVAILADQFISFFKVLQYPLVLYSFCNMREYEKTRSSAVTLSKKKIRLFEKGVHIWTII